MRVDEAWILAYASTRGYALVALGPRSCLPLLPPGPTPSPPALDMQMVTATQGVLITG